jgi:DNA-binding XRE family transcriptional regulator
LASPKPIPNPIREIRDRHRHKQEFVATHLGMSVVSYRRLETQKSVKQGFEVILSLCCLFSCQVFDLAEEIIVNEDLVKITSRNEIKQLFLQDDSILSNEWIYISQIPLLLDEFMKKGNKGDEIAEKLDVSRNTLRNWEKGNLPRHLVSCIRICKLFSCQLIELVDAPEKNKLLKSRLDIIEEFKTGITNTSESSRKVLGGEK